MYYKQHNIELSLKSPVSNGLSVFNDMMWVFLRLQKVNQINDNMCDHSNIDHEKVIIIENL